MLHRDVRLGNILLDSNMNAKLGEVGLSRLQDDPLAHLNHRARDVRLLLPYSCPHLSHGRCRLALSVQKSKQGRSQPAGGSPRQRLSLVSESHCCGHHEQQMGQSDRQAVGATESVNRTASHDADSLSNQCTMAVSHDSNPPLCLGCLDCNIHGSIIRAPGSQLLVVPFACTATTSCGGALGRYRRQQCVSVWTTNS